MIQPIFQLRNFNDPHRSTFADSYVHLLSSLLKKKEKKKQYYQNKLQVHLSKIDNSQGNEKNQFIFIHNQGVNKLN